ncbi:MAG: Gx transporter family protein [Acutalibacteraceae bacterium]|nr:Gx transporter family protein [Acutalibacteraceae bacterium]
MKKNKASLVALMGMFCALAMGLSFLESLIPPIAPVPAIKPGFSNIVTMFCVSSLGVPYGLAVTLFKAFFALLTRGVTAFFMSLAGGLLSLLVMVIIFKFFKNTFGYIGIGILCALFHNIGQLCISVVILGKAMLTLTPLLLLSGLVAGIVTGTVFKYTLPVLNKTLKHSQGVDKND